MRVFFGLGNPGTQYSSTRHNVGFMALDILAQGETFKKVGQSQILKTRIASKDVLLVKPQTFMNLSGSSVQGVLSSYRLRPADIVVFVDDVALDMGRIRVRKNGSHGGQNGLRDIIAKIGPEFSRVRLGVGKCPEKWELSNWVLSKFTQEDQPSLQDMLSKVPNIAEIILEKGIEEAMNAFNAG